MEKPQFYNELWIESVEDVATFFLLQSLFRFVTSNDVTVLHLFLDRVSPRSFRNHFGKLSYKLFTNYQ